MRSKEKISKNLIAIVVGLLTIITPVFNMEVKVWLMANWRILMICFGMVCLFLPLVSWYAKSGVRSYYDEKYRELEARKEDLEKALSKSLKDSEKALSESLNHNKEMLESLVWNGTITQQIVRCAFLDRLTDDQQYSIAIMLFKDCGTITFNEYDNKMANLESYSKSPAGEYINGFREDVFVRLKTNFYESRIREVNKK